MPTIWNDAPGRIVLVTHEHDGGDPFALGTRLGDVFAEHLGAAASTCFASVGILPPLALSSMPRHAYGYEVRNELGERMAIVVGREAALLLEVPDDPLMIWLANSWRYASEHDYLAPIVTAAFPYPGARSKWWGDAENVEVGRQWLEEQRGTER